MATRRLEIELVGDASSLERAFGKSAKSAKGFETGMQKVSRHAAIAGTAIIGGLVVGLGKSVLAANEAMVSQTGMENALKNAGIAYKAHAGEIENVIQHTSKLAALDDEDLQDAFSKLIRTTGSVNTALKDTALVANVARGAHLGLEAATKTVQAAELGRLGALKRLGISVDKVTTAQDALKASHEKVTAAQIAAAKVADEAATKQAAIAALQEKFAGAAAAYGSTGAAANERLGIAVENLEESFGKLLVPTLQVVASNLAAVAGFLAEHETLTKALVIGVGALGGALLAVSVATKTAAAAQVILNAAMAVSPIGAVIIGLAALTVAFVEAWKHSETFRNVVTGAFNAVKAAGQAVVDFVTVKIPASFDAVIGWVRTNWPKIATLISGPFAPLVALATNAFGVRSALEGAFTAVKTFVSSVVESIADYFRALPGKLLGAAKDAGLAVLHGFASGISAFGSMLLHAIIDPLNAIIRKWNSLEIPGVSIDLPSVSVHGHKIGGGSFGVGPFSLPDIPTLAKGGIAFGPTLAMIGERGPEAVVPLGQRGGFGLAAAGAQYAEIHTHVYLDGTQITETVRRELLRTQRRNGTLGFT